MIMFLIFLSMLIWILYGLFIINKLSLVESRLKHNDRRLGWKFKMAAIEIKANLNVEEIVEPEKKDEERSSTKDSNADT